MIVVFVRSIILYLVVILAIRIMGKRQLAEMQAFELVIMIMIADLVVTPVEDVNIPLINGIIPIIALLSMEVIISAFSLKSELFRNFFHGKPSILIHKGKINQSEMRRLRVNMSDLLESLRNKDYFNISDVEYAILETNGQLSVMPRNSEDSSDDSSNGDTPKEVLPIAIIMDGKLNNNKLRDLGHDEQWLIDQLKKNNIDRVEDVFFAFLSTDNTFYVQEKVNE